MVGNHYGPGGALDYLLRDQKSESSVRFVRAPLQWPVLASKEPPPRRWLADQWLPPTATLIAGAGGIGKTTLVQTWATALIHGYSYIGDPDRPLRVLSWFGEDEHDELWRRQRAICSYLGIAMASLDGRLFAESMVDRDMTLAAEALGHFARTPLLDELRDQVNDYGADLIVLDSVARVFGGNENDRHQVTQFIAWILASCGPGRGVLLIGHPAKAIGSEFSGSTAWENSVRSRLYLGTKLPGAKADDDDEPSADDVRYLCRRKANYAAKDWLRMTYREGILVPEERARPAIGVTSDAFEQEIVLRALRKLREIDQAPNASTASSSYLPKLAKAYGLLENLSPKQFAERMRELIMAKRLKSAVIGKNQNRTPKTGLVEASP